MIDKTDLRHVATFCGDCGCGCPELFVDDTAEPERRVVVTDDFGQRIQMSLGQLQDLVTDVKSGVLDRLVTS
ncbi:MAG: hypothetical protein ACT4RN_14625 [Pseudonocardia sp.]